jgi:hypothetical protein
VTLKRFIKNFLLGIPLAIGAMLTLFAVVHSMSVSEGDHGAYALICGGLGIPLLFASLCSLFGNQDEERTSP